MTEHPSQATEHEGVTQTLTAEEREMLDNARHYVGYNSTDEILYAAVERIIAGRTPHIRAEAIREAARRHAVVFGHSTENKLTRAWLRDQADATERH